MIAWVYRWAWILCRLWYIPIYKSDNRTWSNPSPARKQSEMLFFFFSTRTRKGLWRYREEKWKGIWLGSGLRCVERNVPKNPFVTKDNILCLEFCTMCYHLVQGDLYYCQRRWNTSQNALTSEALEDYAIIWAKAYNTSYWRYALGNAINLNDIVLVSAWLTKWLT